jgi:hypothetical protein
MRIFVHVSHIKKIVGQVKNLLGKCMLKYTCPGATELKKYFSGPGQVGGDNRSGRLQALNSCNNKACANGKDFAKFLLINALLSSLQLLRELNPFSFNKATVSTVNSVLSDHNSKVSHVGSSIMNSSV